jgi:hypothetical protein
VPVGIRIEAGQNQHEVVGGQRRRPLQRGGTNERIAIAEQVDHRFGHAGSAHGAKRRNRFEPDRRRHSLSLNET